MTILKITILVLIASNVFLLVWITRMKIAMGHMINDITNLEEYATNLNKSIKVVSEMVKKYLAVEIAKREKENEDSMA